MPGAYTPLQEIEMRARDIGGLMLPFRLRQTGLENWTLRCREVKWNEPIEDSRFKRPLSQ